jgi:hypothetical protein
MAYTMKKERDLMQKIAKSFKKHFALAITFVVAVTVLALATLPQAVKADDIAPGSCGTACCGTPGLTKDTPCVDQNQLKLLTDCGSGKVDTIQVNGQTRKCKTNTLSCGSSDCGNIINKIINPLINVMTGLVGLVVAISLVVAGVMYSSAGGDPSKVAAAKKRINSSVIALIAYLFTFGMLQWLVPGGIF